MTEGHEDYLGDLWDLLPTDPTNFIEDTPTEDESEKVPSSEWAFDHKADVNAHHTEFTTVEHDLAIRHPLVNLDPLVCSEAEAADLIEIHRLVANAHHAKYTNAEARTAINNIFGADGKADSDIDLDSNSLLNADNIPDRTVGAWTKTIGATGDYATFAAAIAVMPCLLDSVVTLVLQQGTILTETCYVNNIHALNTTAYIRIQSARYYPTSGALPTADGAGATYLEDVSVFTVDDFYNDCWILIVDGTGTDNGYVKITDTDQATGRAIVASWPGTQPDNTSKYLIVGALIDSETARARCFSSESCTSAVYLYGIGLRNATSYNLYAIKNNHIDVRYCGLYSAVKSGGYLNLCLDVVLYYCGIVKNNTGNTISDGGIHSNALSQLTMALCGVSDNNQRGIFVRSGGYAFIASCFGNLNGTWGTYAERSAQANCTGSECSGASGNHSNSVGEGALAY
jgi:hypothetical protein